ncbi:MAG: RHS repeat protein [Alphaproteobacteria bacterium]|nr:RHS repeat protein [Alphaproteobacteria bacterium]
MTYNFNGDLTQVDTPNGTTVTYSYDNARRLTGMADDLGNTVAYTLDDDGERSDRAAERPVQCSSNTPTAKPSMRCRGCLLLLGRSRVDALLLLRQEQVKYDGVWQTPTTTPRTLPLTG